MLFLFKRAHIHGTAPFLMKFIGKSSLPPASPVHYPDTAPLPLRGIIKVIGLCLDDLYIPYTCKGAVRREEYPAGDQRIHDVHGFSQLNILPGLGKGYRKRIPSAGCEG